MPCRTLIVEDDPVSAKTLLMLVTMLGHEAALATTVDEALRTLDEFNSECVLLDLELPDGSGVAVLKAIRAKQQPVKVGRGVRSPRTGAGPPPVVFQKPLAIDRVHDSLSAHT